MVTKNDFMLCESISEDDLKAGDKAGDNKNNLANTKFDGCRMMAIKTDGSIILLNRLGHICNANFREIVEDLKAIKEDIFILDGEIISVNDDFGELQKRALTKKKDKIAELQKTIPVKYMVFDVLMFGKENFVASYTDLKDRIEVLEKIFNEKEKFQRLRFRWIEMAEYKPVAEMLEQAHKENREGIIIKNLGSNYEGKRNRSWLKCKFWAEEIMTAIKYEPNNAGIRVEDAKGNACQIQGEQSKEVKDLLDKGQEVKICIQYLEKTKEGRYRFPSYRGLAK